jgi:hypothetical protein
VGDLEGAFKVVWTLAFIGIASVIGGILFGLYKFVTWIF